MTERPPDRHLMVKEKGVKIPFCPNGFRPSTGMISCILSTILGGVSTLRLEVEKEGSYRP
jgi:hypothetical protein